MVRPRRLEVDRSRRHLDAFERGAGLSRPGSNRSSRSGAWHRRAGCLYAGVEPAGLFRSDDGGQSWRHVAGLRNHPSRPKWQPGGGRAHPAFDSFRTPTTNDSFGSGSPPPACFIRPMAARPGKPRNQGTRADFLPEGQNYPEFGQCVHCLVMAPGMPDRLYQQNHCGMYRSDDGGRHWDSIEPGLPSTFGFPAAVHPRDPATLYLLPLNGDTAGRYVPDGKAAVWRTRDCGGSWQALRKGLPQENAFFGVLRQAMATDRLAPAGTLFRHQHGHAVRQRRRGRHLDLHRAVPARDLFGGDAGRRGVDGLARGIRFMPNDRPSLRTRAGRGHASRSARKPLPGLRAAGGAVRRDRWRAIDALDARWPGMRDRLCDSTPAIRRHINVFVDGERAT